MGLTIVSVTAAERLLRHVEALSEPEAEEALRILVRLRARRVLAGSPSPRPGAPTTPVA